MLAPEMAFDAEPRPVVQFLLDQGTRAARLQAERMAAEVDDRAAVGPQREVELIAVSRAADRRRPGCGRRLPSG